MNIPSGEVARMVAALNQPGDKAGLQRAKATMEQLARLNAADLTPQERLGIETVIKKVLTRIADLLEGDATAAKKGDALLQQRDAHMRLLRDNNPDPSGVPVEHVTLSYKLLGSEPYEDTLIELYDYDAGETSLRRLVYVLLSEAYDIKD